MFSVFEFRLSVDRLRRRNRVIELCPASAIFVFGTPEYDANALTTRSDSLFFFNCSVFCWVHLCCYTNAMKKVALFVLRFVLRTAR